MIKKIVGVIKKPEIIWFYMVRKRLLDWLPDEIFIKIRYWISIGTRLNLNVPSSLNEKLQWLKLNDRNPKYIELVDKYEVKKHIANLIGEKYVIPTLGVWDCFDEIDFSKLPHKFVLKCTHDSGGIVVVKNKELLEYDNIKAKFEKALKYNYYYAGREWPYKNLKPRIIAEKYMSDNEQTEEFTDYKFYCFDGYVDCVMVCYDRASGDTKFYFFDDKWNLKRINKRGKEAQEGFTLPKPECIDEMFEIASKLSQGVPFVRVDLYQSCGQVYFGELTFFPGSGFDPNYLPETDQYFGDLIDLRKAYNK